MSFSGLAQTETKSAVPYDSKEKDALNNEAAKLSKTSFGQVVDTPLSEEAWQNYYDMSVGAAITTDSKQISESEQEILDEILRTMEQYIPSSFTYHYSTYVNEKHNPTFFNSLNAAYQQQPANPATYDDFMAYGQITNDLDLRKEFSQKLEAANMYTSAQMDYNFNVLQSCGTEGFLLTNGNEDTYPVFIEQDVRNTNNTLQVVNLDHLVDDTYAKQVYDEMGIPYFKLEREADPIDAAEHILKHEPAAPVYLALTLPSKFLKSHYKDLWLTGLAFRFDPRGEYNNVADLETNWKARFRKEHIQDPEEINKNYLLLLAMLNDYFDSTGQFKERNEVSGLLRILAPPKSMKETKVKTITSY